ncbi:probable protein S-acyltransferase 7 [Salvia miltiorrhiza]|uniref:probable protein S-acyltransferase 7 n=1 Tax=Salvia miltiorrhiza TaxID=226208 RepID=UPI0025ACDA3A|nr:probable protein S-acyltransferase 7 [Salvia miltiorrhiza]
MYSPKLQRLRAVDSSSRLRVYQVWKGRNKFFCGGRIIFGPDVKSIFLTLSLILIPVILFWAFVAKHLISLYSHGGGIILVVSSVLLTAYIIVLLFLTSGTDPGIVPRNPQPPDLDDDSSGLSTDWGGSQSSACGVPLTKNVSINGIVVKVKYCQTCMLYRPPRCSHCSICNNCVERFDHHCPWVGQCIGKRNYRFFFMFVSSTTLLCLHVLFSCSINITSIMHKKHCSMWMAIQQSPVSGILITYTFVICWFVGGLTTFHLYLISSNQTTYENFRYQYDRKMNPYNVGIARNCMEVFCSKMPRSRNNFRALIKGDSPVGLYKGPTTDVEMGRRRGIDADDFEDPRNRIGNLGRLERCRTQPRHDHLEERRGNWR